MLKLAYRLVLTAVNVAVTFQVGFLAPAQVFAKDSFDLPLTNEQIEKVKPDLIDAIQCGAATITEWGVVAPVSVVSTVAGLLLLLPGLGISCLDGACDLNPDHSEKTKLDAAAGFFTKTAGWVTVPVELTSDELNEIQKNNCRHGKGSAVY